MDTNPSGGMTTPEADPAAVRHPDPATDPLPPHSQPSDRDTNESVHEWEERGGTR